VPEPIRCALAAVRQSRGLTQVQLARLVGLTQPGLSHLEHGVAPKGLVSAHKLAAALRCTVADLWPDLPVVARRSPQRRPQQQPDPAGGRRQQSSRTGAKILGKRKQAGKA
jgi:transcriptional regulator with XRE-family HTH domain